MASTFFGLACSGAQSPTLESPIEPEAAAELPTHFATYDKGWTIRPRDKEKTPFELKLELHNQFRYTFFEAADEPVFNSAGQLLDIPDRNDFDINRGRLVFSGYAFDEDLQFYANVDYNTVASNSIQPLLSWISYRYNDRLKLYGGLGKVPGTWEWQQTSRYTQGIDRSLATTFFRPSISAGVWANGDIGENAHYTAFVGDGFNTLTLRASQLDTNFVYSLLSWWEPWGEFGPGFSDLEFQDSPVIRLGHSVTQTRNQSSPDLTPGPEGTVIRLTDGTQLITPGALQAGETVNAFDIWLYSLHAGYKHRGLSVSGEYYLRWLSNIESAAGTSFDPIFDQGFFAQTGIFVRPESLEVFLRGSQVTGDAGSGDEKSIGFNWFPYAKRNTRFTFEVADVNASPAQQSRTGYVAGGSGLLIRTQLWTFF